MLLIGMIVLGLCIFILLRLVGCQDVITTIAGIGTGTYSGDNVQATSSALYAPSAITLDSSGTKVCLQSLYFFL